VGERRGGAGSGGLSDAESAFVVTMFCVPGRPMLEPVSAEELEERRDRRAPRP